MVSFYPDRSVAIVFVCEKRGQQWRYGDILGYILYVIYTQIILMEQMYKW
jgi:hypothetical protein